MNKPKTVSGMSLEAILATTQLSIHQDEFMLIGLAPSYTNVLESLLPDIDSDFVQYIREADVLTLLLPRRSWDKISLHFPDATTEGPLKIFTFTVAMDWQVVGFLAAITQLLAQAGIPLGAVCGYYRDHLFIAANYAAQSEVLLRKNLEKCRQLARKQSE